MLRMSYKMLLMSSEHYKQGVGDSKLPEGVKTQNVLRN